MSGAPDAIGAGGLVSVLTPLPIDRCYDYRAPDGAALAPGDFVEVEVGPNRMVGVVWGPGAGDAPEAKVKRVLRRLDLPPMGAGMRAFIEKVAAYTLTPLGAVLRLATRAPDLAAGPKKRTLYALAEARPVKMTPARERVIAALEAHAGAPMAPSEIAAAAGVSAGVVKALAEAGALTAREVSRDPPFDALDWRAEGVTLSDGQAVAAAALAEKVAARSYSATLLKGVTGSGKTEVYLEAVAACLREGRQALVLIPEIALTAAFLDRIAARFGGDPAEWHSGVTSAERRRVWRGVGAGAARVVVGARSALFLPFEDLGLVVVDEEHEAAYKQEEGALYNARDMAVLRGAMAGAAVVLASATPSLETWANADAGKYGRIDLPERYGVARPPAMRTLDLRVDGPEKGRWIAPPLAREVFARLERREQSLLFLNRRGYAPLTVCRACGHFFECPDCDARLVEHRFRKRLLCHQCGHEAPVPETCPACGRADRLSVSGPGVERIMEEAERLFPDARIALMSSDLFEGSAGLKERVASIARGEADIIIGTQMVAKGHNFPLLTLVGVIDADIGLQNGDLRAAERTFQLMRQVAGRAGRADKPGVAIVQTAAPDHPVMQAIISGEDEAFWRSEAEARRAAGAPPYGKMAGIIVSGLKDERVWKAARDLGRAGALIERAGARLFGPTPAPIARIRGRSRVRLLVKAPKGVALQALLREWLAAAPAPSGVRVAVDVDPQSFL